VSSLFAGRDVIVALIGGRGGGKRERGFIYYLLSSHLKCLEPSAKGKQKQVNTENKVRQIFVNEMAICLLTQLFLPM